MDDMQVAECVAAAERIGAEHGRNAGTWFFDGNTSSETYERVVAGLDAGDPEVLDSFPYADLSGQWADGYTPLDLVADVGWTRTDEDIESGRYDWIEDDLCSAYEQAFADAAAQEIETTARAHVG